MSATPAWPPKSLPRLFVRQPLGEGALIALDGPQANYLRNVLRMGEDAQLLLFDGASGEWLARPEWEALCVHAAGGGAPPPEAPTVGRAVMMIARLGGFLARKGDGDPGAEVIWRGMTRLRILTEAWLAFRPEKCG